VLPEIHTFPVYGLIVSRSNHNLIKHYEADYIFNYRTEDVASQIKAAAPDLTYVFNTIGSPDSSATASSAVRRKGKLCTVHPSKANTEKVAKDVEVSSVLCGLLS
jgi:NADPH:quinone reductase-like Zn-dependent oxidoreductase